MTSLNLSFDDPVEMIPAGKFIQSVIRLDDENIIPNAFSYLLDYSEANHLSITGDLTGQILAEYGAEENVCFYGTPVIPGEWQPTLISVLMSPATV